MNYLKMDTFVADYLTCASWVTVDDVGECTDFSEEAKYRASKDCSLFFRIVAAVYDEDKAIELLSKQGDEGGYLAAHDFFLTRNGHGVGFWDRADIYGKEEAKMLTLLSRAIGNVDVVHKNRSKLSKLIFD